MTVVNHVVLSGFHTVIREYHRSNKLTHLIFVVVFVPMCCRRVVFSFFNSRVSREDMSKRVRKMRVTTFSLYKHARSFIYGK